MSNNSIQPKVSVIVPVYNAETYLPVCIDSICKQRLQELEIIIINDGSTDSSGLVADRLAAKENRIRVVHQKNRGPSVTRNKGLSLATGRYISFIDADDWIEVDMLQSMYQAAESRNLDVVITGVTVEYTKEGRSVILNAGQYVEARELAEIRNLYISLRDKKLFDYVWNKLYSSRLLREYRLRFQVELPFEDESFNMQVFMHAGRMGLLTDHPYHYMRNDEASIVASYTANFLKAYQDKVQVYEAFFSYLQMNEEVTKSFLQKNQFATYCVYLQSLYKANAHLNRKQRVALIRLNIYNNQSFMQSINRVAPANIYEKIFRILLLCTTPGIMDGVYRLLFFFRYSCEPVYRRFRKNVIG